MSQVVPVDEIREVDVVEADGVRIALALMDAILIPVRHSHIKVTDDYRAPSPNNIVMWTYRDCFVFFSDPKKGDFQCVQTKFRKDWLHYYPETIIFRGVTNEEFWLQQFVLKCDWYDKESMFGLIFFPKDMPNQDRLITTRSHLCQERVHEQVRAWLTEHPFRPGPEPYAI